MGVLESGRAGLVEHGGDAETGLLEGLKSQKTLRPVGVGGYGDHHAGAGDVDAPIGELGLQVTQIAGENLQNGEGTVSQPYRRRSGQGGGGQDPFEAAQQRSALVSCLPGGETVNERPLVQRCQRGDEVVLVAVLVGEADNGIVPPVSTRHDGTCRPQVDSQIDVCC